MEGLSSTSVCDLGWCMGLVLYEEFMSDWNLSNLQWS